MKLKDIIQGQLKKSGVPEDKITAMIATIPDLEAAEGLNDALVAGLFNKAQIEADYLPEARKVATAEFYSGWDAAALEKAKELGATEADFKAATNTKAKLEKFISLAQAAVKKAEKTGSDADAQKAEAAKNQVLELTKEYNAKLAEKDALIEAEKAARLAYVESSEIEKSLFSKNIATGGRDKSLFIKTLVMTDLNNHLSKIGAKGVYKDGAIKLIKTDGTVLVDAASGKEKAWDDEVTAFLANQKYLDVSQPKNNVPLNQNNQVEAKKPSRVDAFEQSPQYLAAMQKYPQGLNPA
jgi:hypothetical protein